jgi:hypothetical protein
MSDRTIHAAYDGMEIVRYDRTGKWYLEPTDSRLPRQQVPIAKAVDSALWAVAHGGWVKRRLPGGQRFDRLIEGARS